MSDNLFRRGNVWWARAQVAGRDVKRSLRTTDRAEARKRLKAWLEELSHIRFFGEARPTYKDAVVRWAEEYLPAAVKPSTAQRYLVSVKQLDPHFADLYVDQITRRKIGVFISARRKEGATNATIRRDLTALSRILSCCVAWGWRDDNPARDYDRSIIRERRDPIRPPTDEEINAAIAEAPAMVGRIALFAWQTGVRQGEAVTLTHDQVNLKRGEIQLLKTKTNRPRVIPLTDPLVAPAAGTIAGTPRHISSPYVFWHGDGLPYLRLANQFKLITKRAGVQFRFHDLRHRFAIDYLQASGGNIYRLKEILGHTSVSTTEIYLRFLGPEAGTKAGTGTTVLGGL